VPVLLVILEDLKVVNFDDDPRVDSSVEREERVLDFPVPEAKFGVDCPVADREASVSVSEAEIVSVTEVPDTVLVRIVGIDPMELVAPLVEAETVLSVCETEAVLLLLRPDLEVVPAFPVPETVVAFSVPEGVVDLLWSVPETEATLLISDDTLFVADEEVELEAELEEDLTEDKLCRL
jgi:hypothetical protein